MNKANRTIIAVALAMSVSPLWAQSDTHSEHMPPPAAPDTGTEQMDHNTMPGMNHDAMPGMDHGAMTQPSKATDSMPGMDHSGHATMQNEPAPSELRDPHAYSGGYDFSQLPMRHDAHELTFGVFRIDRLEGVRTRDRRFTVYDIQATYGGDFNRAVLKAEGDVDGGDLEEASTELLWSHAAASFWNTQLGLRYDSGEGPERSWLAFGMQGLAPYWFEIDATAYVGQAGRTSLNVEAEYELLLTQKLILQPRIEADLFGDSDAARGIGPGLSGLTAGVRMRYEIRREIAPYIGIEWSGKFGGTADYARDARLDTKETRAVAGVRVWF